VRTRLTGGRIVDPVNGRDAVGDVWIEDERVIAPPEERRADATYDLAGKIVMAGGIDIHSHIASGNVNTARLMLPERRRRPADPELESYGTSALSTFENGRLYAQMGYSLVVEPAANPNDALHSHLELALTPFIDRGNLLVLGNEDFLLRLIRDRESPAAIADYVAAMLQQGRGLGVKVINAGGAAAFKANVRAFDFDDVVPAYGVTSREIVLALQEAVAALGVPHPLHVHCNNLGMAGNSATALQTMDAAGDRRMHLAHLQFYGYGSEGEHGFSSAAPQLAERLKASPNVTVDVGQVMFGPTVTVSSDTLRQYAQRGYARPRKWSLWDGDGNGGGVYPLDYRERDFVSALQWAIGLELFLLIEDPWQVYFTTDHPNGAPFTSYPDLLHLLMDAGERDRWMDMLPDNSMQMTSLRDIRREYSLAEIAIMTRAAPARLLGLPDRGHLGPGALADVAVYDDSPQRAAAFRNAHLVFKSGELIVRDGSIVTTRFGRTLSVQPPSDLSMKRRLAAHYDQTYGLSPDQLSVREAAVAAMTQADEVFEEVACRS
jgi:formylmethanofuran dehydrogenase subunit A